MIAFEGVSARAAGASVSGVSVAWGEGVHAVVGAPGDGGPCVLALLAGLAKPRSGRVRVLGGDPGDLRVRRCVAYVPLKVELPDGLRVGEVLDLAATIREASTTPRQSRGRAVGGRGHKAAERLALLGVESLARRVVRSLAPGEARAIALVEALTSGAEVLALEEPFVSLDPRAVARLPEALRRCARGGVAVVVATASVRDAGDLGDDYTLLRAGALVGELASLEPLAEFSPSGARVRLHTNDTTTLLAALAREPAVEAVARRDGSVVARGRDVAELARAAARAVVASGVEVTQMRFDPPTLEEARAAAAGVAAATYQLAFERTRAAAAAAPTAPAIPPPQERTA